MATTSIAPSANGAAGTFRIVHPFHPGHGQQFAIVTIRQNWGEYRVYYRDHDDQFVGIPTKWTDVVAPDPGVALSAGRSPFRLEDLLDLTRLVAALEQEVSHER